MNSVNSTWIWDNLVDSKLNGSQPHDVATKKQADILVNS